MHDFNMVIQSQNSCLYIQFSMEKKNFNPNCNTKQILNEKAREYISVLNLNNTSKYTSLYMEIQNLQFMDKVCHTMSKQQIDNTFQHQRRDITNTDARTLKYKHGKVALKNHTLLRLSSKY